MKIRERYKVMRTWPWEVLSLLFSQETWLHLTSKQSESCWKKRLLKETTDNTLCLESWVCKCNEQLSQHLTAQLTEIKCIWKGLQRGRCWKCQVSAAWPVRQANVWRWPYAGYTFTGAGSDHAQSVFLLFTLFVTQEVISSQLVSFKATQWSFSFQPEQRSPHIFTDH